MDYAQDFREFVLSHPAEKSGDSSRYSGSSRVHYGLSNPTMRDFVKQWGKDHPSFKYDDWEATLTSLYQGESIDEHCLAGFMLGQYKQFRGELPLDVFDRWIGYLEGWREIDTTCQSNFTTKEILSKWDEWQPFLVDLSQRETIQHRRASLVLLIKPVRDSADSRLITTALENVDRLKYEKDKLIFKAISWILRESIKQHREIVGAYVKQNEHILIPLVVREFQNKYETGKK